MNNLPQNLDDNTPKLKEAAESWDYYLQDSRPMIRQLANRLNLAWKTIRELGDLLTINRHDYCRTSNEMIGLSCIHISHFNIYYQDPESLRSEEDRVEIIFKAVLPGTNKTSLIMITADLSPNYSLSVPEEERLVPNRHKIQISFWLEAGKDMVESELKRIAKEYDIAFAQWRDKEDSLKTTLTNESPGYNPFGGDQHPSPFSFASQNSNRVTRTKVVVEMVIPANNPSDASLLPVEYYYPEENDGAALWGGQGNDDQIMQLILQKIKLGEENFVDLLINLVNNGLFVAIENLRNEMGIDGIKQ